MKWKAEYYPIRKVSEEELKSTLILSISKVNKKCFKCGERAFDTCYNCEQPICQKHMIAYYFLQTPDGHGMIILAVCEECVKENNLDVIFR